MYAQKTVYTVPHYELLITKQHAIKLENTTSHRERQLIQKDT